MSTSVSCKLTIWSAVAISHASQTLWYIHLRTQGSSQGGEHTAYSMAHFAF